MWRIDAWLIARDIDRDHVTETTAKAWSAAGELVVGRALWRGEW
jgi:hypothetical protein